jgi:hypothetical protein
VRNQFVALDNIIYNINLIKGIDISNLEAQMIVVKLEDDSLKEVYGRNALELVWQLKPSSLEGKNYIKWHRHHWAIHNLIAHPLMQILAWLRLYDLAIFVHDITVPAPIRFK